MEFKHTNELIFYVIENILISDPKNKVKSLVRAAKSLDKILKRLAHFQEQLQLIAKDLPNTLSTQNGSQGNDAL